MQQIVTFFIKYKNAMLFLLLLGISLVFFIRSHPLQETNFFNSTSWITGNIYNAFNAIDEYFGLKKNNTLLIEENKKLREALFNERIKDDSDTFSPGNYKVINAKVIKNSFAKTKNYLTINKGNLKEINEDMGVITSKGIIGIIEDTSRSFARVQSILNEYSRINAKVKRTNHFGTLQWNALDHNIVQLVDIPRLADIAAGDTIITGGMSTIFPEGIPIGVIKDFRLDDSQNYFVINVALFNDMTALEHVYVIKNIQKDEILNLQQAVENE